VKGDRRVVAKIQEVSPSRARLNRTTLPVMHSSEGRQSGRAGCPSCGVATSQGYFAKKMLLTCSSGNASNGR